jgi:hypothetical protein
MGRETRATNGSPPCTPRMSDPRPKTRSGRPHADGSMGAPWIRSRLAHRRYPAITGIAKPCERFGNSAHSRTIDGKTGA